MGSYECRLANFAIAVIVVSLALILAVIVLFLCRHKLPACLRYFHYKHSLEVYGYIFKGNNCVIFGLASLFMEQAIKGKKCSSRSKVYPLRVDTILEGQAIQEIKQNVLKNCPLHTV